MVKLMHIETERLIIRPYVEQDLMDCFRLMQDKDLFRYMDMEVMSLEEYKGLFQWLIDSYNIGFDGDYKYSFNILLKETGKHIGWVGVGGVDYDHKTKEIFWLIGKEYWNQGYASEGASALLKYCFDIIGADEIVALCKPENIASRKVMENIGLQYRGIMTGLPVEHDSFNGEPLYSLTREEYNM